MGENDYESGYRGNQFHHGMDRAEYERGKGQKELEDTLGGAGKTTPVDGVAFTLLLVAPLIWMVYPVLGVTILIVPTVIAAIFIAFHQVGWGFFLAFIFGVISFFPGMAFEARVSQFTVYRWVRGLLRFLFAFGAVVIFGSGADLHTRHFTPQPGAIVGGFFVAIIAYLIFQRLDLIYFPSQKEMNKMTEKIIKGERITRPLGKRLLWGFCWFIPVMMVLNMVLNIGVRFVIEEAAARKDFYAHYGDIIFCVNAAIWYGLCLFGKLPGTSKNRYTEKQEQDIKEILSQKSSA